MLNHPGLGHPKPTPAKTARALVKAERERVDRVESEKVRARSKGRCEMSLSHGRLAGPRCPRRATEVHHLLGGIGRRGRGESALASNKVHLCDRCHASCTAHEIEAYRTEAGKWVFERRS